MSLRILLVIIIRPADVFLSGVQLLRNLPGVIAKFQKPEQCLARYRPLDVPEVGPHLVSFHHVKRGRTGIEAAIQTMSQFVAKTCLFLPGGHGAGVVQPDYPFVSILYGNAAQLWQGERNHRDTGLIGQLVKVSRRECYVLRCIWQIASLPRIARR